MHCAQTAEGIDTTSFAYDSRCLFQIVLKYGLHQSTPYSQILSQSGPPPLDLSVADIPWQIAACGFNTLSAAAGCIEDTWRHLANTFLLRDIQRSTPSGGNYSSKQCAITTGHHPMGLALFIVPSMINQYQPS